MSLRLLMMTALLAAALPALAGGSGVMRVTGDDQTRQLDVEFLDRATVRLQGEDQPDSYLVLRDGRVYTVLGGGDDVQVLDLAAVMGNMRGFRQPDGQFKGMMDEIQRVESLEPTGRSETVAGIDGEVWLLTYADDDGNTHSRELVLSDDETVRELTEAMLGLGQTMAALTGREMSVAGREALIARLEEEQAGMLRLGDAWTLDSLSADTPAQTRFELPAPPQEKADLSSLRKLREMRRERGN